MAATTATSLPPLAPFPDSRWRAQLQPQDWEACLDAWISLIEAHISLQEPAFSKITIADESVGKFLHTYTKQLAEASPDIPTFNAPIKAQQLRKDAFMLVKKLVSAETCPKYVVDGYFVMDFCRAYGKKAERIVASLWSGSNAPWEQSIGECKSKLIPELEAGIKSDPRRTEALLRRLNQLLDASPETAAFYMSGSDFLDGLISCYKLMNPPLRKAILATSYLCLIGLTKGTSPNYSLLIDTLYAMKDAAEKHKASFSNANDSLVPELISVTPILSQLKNRISEKGAFAARGKPIIQALEGFKKPVSGRPKRLIKRKIDKGKGAETPIQVQIEATAHIHVHRMSLVSQIKDLFPDLGEGFIFKLLDDYNDNVERIISHLLEESLPPHLAMADRHEKLPASAALAQAHHFDLSPRPTPPQSPSLPSRRNIYDDDEFDNLDISSNKLHFGRKDEEKTADDVLKDRSGAPEKARILAALAAFDSDDDERDDTYDTADVGGTVEVSGPDSMNTYVGSTAINSDVGGDPAQDAMDEVLFKAWKTNQSWFARDSNTRKQVERAALRKTTGLTDEAIEGWAMMLSRDPRRMRKLEAKFSGFSGQTVELRRSKWVDSGTEGEAGSGSGREWGSNDRGRGGRLRGAPRGRGGVGGRGRGGSVAGAPSDQGTKFARDRKTANKGKSVAHARDKKTQRTGGFPGGGD